MKMKFAHNLPLEQTMMFEEIYSENLQMSLEEKKELLEEGTEFVYLLNDETNELIGETYFIPLDNMEDWDAAEEQPNEGLDDFYGKNCVYFYSTTILEKHQGFGYGKLLKSYALGYCKAKGFNYSVGHARYNGSIQLNEYFGAEVIEKFDNWYQTGETYYLYKQLL